MYKYTNVPTYLCTYVPMYLKYLCTNVPLYECTCTNCTYVPMYKQSFIPLYLCRNIPMFLRTYIYMFLGTYVLISRCSFYTSVPYEPLYLRTSEHMYLCSYVPVSQRTAGPINQCTYWRMYLIYLLYLYTFKSRQLYIGSYVSYISIYLSTKVRRYIGT